MKRLKDDQRKFNEAVGERELSDDELASLAAELNINPVRAAGVIRRQKFARRLVDEKQQHNERIKAAKRAERKQRRTAKKAARHSPKKSNSKQEPAGDGDVQR